MRRAWLLPILLLLVTGAWAQGSGSLRRYSALELLPIENNRNEKGQKIPDEFVPDLRESLVYVIVGQHLFRRVEDHTDDAVIATGPENVLQLKVRIVGYTGAQNNAGVSAMVHFIDKQTGTEIFQRKRCTKARDTWAKCPNRCARAGICPIGSGTCRSN